MSNIIKILKERGFLDAVTHEEVESLVQTPQKVYCGFDPTADSLHLGNLVPIMGLAWFQRHGHTPVAIVGGATGLIGDPSGKSHERPLLSPEVIKENLRGITENIKAVLCIDPTLPQPIILNNYDWYKEINLIQFLRDIGKQFRMGPMLAKDAVRTRLSSEEGMSFTEFCYQLLQGNDFLYLYDNHNVTVQFGGSDQWGNITAGIELVRKVRGKAVYGVTFPLITRSDGKKLGKTESGSIWLSPNKVGPYEFFQYLYRIPDKDVIHLMKILTFMENEEIQDYQEMMGKQDYIPNTAQKKLASEVTRIIHGEEGLQKALEVTEAVSPGSKTTLSKESLLAIATDMPNFTTDHPNLVDKKLVDVIVDLKIKSSKGEVRRLIRNGGVSINNSKVNDENFVIEEKNLVEGELILLSLGKKNKILIHVEQNNGL